MQSLDIKLGELIKIIIIRRLTSVSRKPSYPPRGDALFWISAILTKGFAKKKKTTFYSLKTCLSKIKAKNICF